MIQGKRLLEEFQRLVAIDAESFHEQEMAAYLTERLQQKGLTVEADAAGNLYTLLPGTIPGEALLFAAHMDTVSPGIGKRAICREDGRITSAGDTVLGGDDAAAIAEILEVLTVLQEEALPHPDLELVFFAAEEPFCQGSRVFDFRQIKSRIAYVPDLGGAPGTAVLAAPTILSFQVTIRGKSAHAGFSPESGIHAIAIAAQAISRLPQGHVQEETTLNIGTISGGTARNIVPDQVILTGEIRSFSDEKAGELWQQTETVFRQAAEEAGGSVEVTCVREVKAYRLEEDEAVLTRFRRACARCGITPRLQKTLGGSDNNRLTEHGIRGTVLSCGYEQAHTCEEYCRIEWLTGTAELLLALASEEGRRF